MLKRKTDKEKQREMAMSIYKAMLSRRKGARAALPSTRVSLISDSTFKVQQESTPAPLSAPSEAGDIALETDCPGHLLPAEGFVERPKSFPRLSVHAI